MSLVTEMVKLLTGSLILVYAVIMIMGDIVEPSVKQLELNYNARADKSVEYSFSFNEGTEIHDQHVGRLPIIDPATGFNHNDTGNSRRYFRPEQFIMLPAVDTDVSSNVGTGNGVRVVAVSQKYKADNGEGLYINLSPFSAIMPYMITRDSLYERQITFNSINNGGIFNSMKSAMTYPSIHYGTQVNGSTALYGGFNLTVESGIHSLSGKKGNTLIFVEGRVPSR